MNKYIYYKFENNGVLRSIWFIDNETRLRVRFDMGTGKYSKFPNGLPCNVLTALELIEEEQFNYLYSIWQFVGKMNKEVQPTEVGYSNLMLNFREAVDETTKSIKLENAAKKATEFKAKIKEDKRVKTEYQLYNEDNSIAIYGFSTKTSQELVDFFEIHVREEGCRILNQRGLTTGFVHADLFNTLSYHIKDI
jgi:hypothetical protein